MSGVLKICPNLGCPWRGKPGLSLKNHNRSCNFRPRIRNITSRRIPPLDTDSATLLPESCDQEAHGINHEKDEDENNEHPPANQVEAYTFFIEDESTRKLNHTVNQTKLLSILFLRLARKAGSADLGELLSVMTAMSADDSLKEVLQHLPTVK